MGEEHADAVSAASLLLGPPTSGIGGAHSSQSPEAMAMLRAAVQAAQAVGIDPTMALAHMPLMMSGAAMAAASAPLDSSVGVIPLGGESDATMSGDSPPIPQDGSLSIDGITCLPASEEPAGPSTAPAYPPEIHDATQPAEVHAAPAPALQSIVPDTATHGAEEAAQWEQWRRLQQLQQLQQLQALQQQQQQLLLARQQQEAAAAAAAQGTANGGAQAQLLMQMGVPPTDAPGAYPTSTVYAAAPAPAAPMMQPVGGGICQPVQPPSGGGGGGGAEEFTCTVCRKVFKRAANLIFHMTEHRPAAPGTDGQAASETQLLAVDSTSAPGGGPSTGVGPVKCTDCDKEFATKYQAKKHCARACMPPTPREPNAHWRVAPHTHTRSPMPPRFVPAFSWFLDAPLADLRRHFQGDKPFACTKCHKKRFVVKEDLTMHMKACGNVFICRCGIRLCSLGALKRHCKQFQHEPESLEPKPESALAILSDPSAPAWAAASDALPAPYVAMVAEQQQQQLQLQQHAAAAAAAAMAAAQAGGDSAPNLAHL